MVSEQEFAKKTRDELAFKVRPRKKSETAKRLLAEHYGQGEESEAAPAETQDAAQTPEPDVTKAPEQSPAEEQEALPKDGETLPDDHKNKDKEAPINEGEKVEFDTDPDED